jgi:hypothetical protein
VEQEGKIVEFKFELLEYAQVIKKCKQKKSSNRTKKILTSVTTDAKAMSDLKDTKQENTPLIDPKTSSSSKGIKF